MPPAAGFLPAADLGLGWIAGEYTANASVTKGEGQAVNPYAYFGECTLWPRGRRTFVGTLR